MTEREIRKILTDERKARRMTQMAVIMRTARNGVPFVSLTSLSVYERGVAVPSIDKLSAWAEALDFEIVIRRKKGRD